VPLRGPYAGECEPGEADQPVVRGGDGQIVLRHARFSVTMEIYTQVSSTATREALKRLGESLDG
jgi:hypothetical protein